MNATAFKYLTNIMESTAFRIVTVLLGLALCAFYGAVMFGAIICNPMRILIDYFPDSSLFLGVYLGGVISGLLCFIYSANPRKRKAFFVIILPFFTFMIFMLTGNS